MKLTSVFLLLFAVAAATAAHGQVIINGDFETGSLSPWTTNGWVVDTVNPHQGRYCAWDTGGHWLKQDFDPLPAWSTCVFFWARQIGPSSPANLDVLYSDNTSQRIEFNPLDTWNACLADSLLDCRKSLTGIRFWSTTDGATFLDDIMMPWRDLAVTAIVSPVGESLRVGDSVVPAATARNNSAIAGRAWVWAHFIHENLPDEHWDSAWVSGLAAGAVQTVWFRDWIPRFAGWYRFFISFDPLCTTYRRLLVLDSSGIAEHSGAKFTRRFGVSTIRSSPAPVACCLSSVTVRDVSGALLSRGPAAALSPGVYFIETEGRRERIVFVR